MGTGIGIVASRVANLEVVFVDPAADSLKKSENFVQKWCKKEIEKQRLTEQQMKDVLGRTQWTSEVANLSNVDFVIEAVNEDFELKKKIF